MDSHTSSSHHLCRRAQRHAYKPPPPRTRYCTPQHQARKQGNTRGPTPKAVGLIRLLCGLWMGQSQRTLPRAPATRALPHKITHPQTQRCAHIDDKTLCHSTTQNARTTLRPAGDAPHNGTRISRRRPAQGTAPHNTKHADKVARAGPRRRRSA